MPRIASHKWKVKKALILFLTLTSSLYMEEAFATVYMMPVVQIRTPELPIFCPLEYCAGFQLNHQGPRGINVDDPLWEGKLSPLERRISVWEGERSQVSQLCSLGQMITRVIPGASLAFPQNEVSLAYYPVISPPDTPNTVPGASCSINIC